MQAKQKQMMDQLKSADEPSQTYTQQQLAAHRNTIDLFQQYADQGDNQQLQQFAQQTLPTLQEHLEMVQDLPASQ